MMRIWQCGYYYKLLLYQNVRIYQLFYAFQELIRISYTISYINYPIKIFFMDQSVMSRASNASSLMLEELANRSVTAKILRSEGTFNDQQMRLIWNALGLYISRNLRMGRGVNIPKLGVFTFTPPEVRLKGVTNQKQRDQRPRIPVFLIQKQFVKGLPLKTAIFYHQQFGLGLRPYASLGTTGDVPITKMNLMEVSSYANMSKDATELAINRIIKYISEKLLAGQNVNIQIPNVGQLICRNNLVAVKFNQYLHRDTRTILSKSVDERKIKGNMSLTADNLKKFSHLAQMSQKLSNAPNQMLDIDEKTKTFLQTDFGFHFDEKRDPMQNSLTDFGRTYATRQFDPKHTFLKTANITKMTQTGFLTGQVKSFNRDYNMALRIVKQWVLQNCPVAQQSFGKFVQLSGRKNEVMTENDVWQACKKISQDITQQQSHELFRLLDVNKDGFVTKDDWRKNITFDTNYLVKSTIQALRRKNVKSSAALRQMGLEGISSVDVFTLSNALKKLNPTLTQQQALFLSRYIAKGSQTVAIQNVLQMLNLGQSHPIIIDKEWEEKFLTRLKKKMYDRNIFEEQLQNRFRLHDKNRTGFIEQTQLKNVLAELGISLTLSELLKIVKLFPINEKNHINYQSILQKLSFAQGEAPGPITQQHFLQIIKPKILEANKLPFELPISVRKMTSLLQSNYFKDQQQSHLINFVRKIDVNKNDQISQEDINAYKMQIKQKKNYAPQKSCKVNLQQLIIKLKQKSIKKKISFFDVFNKLDENKDGFITYDQWAKNIEFFLPLGEDQKQLLFEYMDVSKLHMIDYKTFLNFMNGKENTVSQKYDWVEECFDRIKQWFRTSGLTLIKAFKLVDRDGDSYITQKDLNQFLIDKIKYQPREINHVRLQKLLKVFDTFKRGKVDEHDWERVINNQSVNWVGDAKQQVGIIISRLYPTLSEAFYDITQGDQKLLFNSFKAWIQKKKALSGFIPNQDIMKKIFSELDVHKKGYLLEADFISCFGGYNWKSEQVNEFISKVVKKFKTCEQAYKCINAYNKQKLNEARFTKFVEQLFGSRFKNSDIKNIWKSLSTGNSTITVEQFEKRVGKQWNDGVSAIDKQYPKDDWRYEDFTIIKGTQIRTDQHSYNETQTMQTQVRKIVKSVKEILGASPNSLQQAFQKVDTQKSGKLTNLQFKKAFRNLNIALTSKQLDLLLNYCDYKVQTLINWKQFIRRFHLSDDQIKMNKRIQPRLQHLSDLLHFYMVSPKDAYRKWNNPRTGYMNFEEFHKMLRELYTLGNQSLPELSIIKQLFEHIDIRKDDQLDFQQFTQTFRNCNPPSLLMGTVPATKEVKSARVKESKQKDKPTREQQVPLFKHSPVYEQFVKFIGRNRKFIQQKIEAEFGKQQRLIPFKNVKGILTEVASSNKLQFTEAVVRNSLAFAMTGQNIDYRLMLQNFKGRGQDIVDFPLKKMF